MMRSTVWVSDPELGKLYLPDLARLVSFPGKPARRAVQGEVGIFVAKQRRLVNGVWQLVWSSVTHNERVDAGAQQQALQCLGGGGTPGSPSTTLFPNVVAVANASLSKAKGDQSLGSASSGVTTNEFTATGLARHAKTASAGGDYTAPASLGGTFSQVVQYTFTATGSATAYGAGLFDSVTVVGSILYVEDNFSSTAVLVNNDTLLVTITITN